MLSLWGCNPWGVPSSSCVKISLYVQAMTNGDAQFWTYSCDQYNWTQNGSWDLIGADGGHVTSVVYDEKTRTLFWCQESKRSGDNQLKMRYSVCSLTLPRGTLLSPASEVWGKVMFSQVFVCQREGSLSNM